MAKRVLARGVKIHRQYAYDALADVLGVTIQTMRRWRALGLVVLDGQRPHFIPGHELKRFLQSRMPKARRKLAQDEFYCMPCRASRGAYGAMRHLAFGSAAEFPRPFIRKGQKNLAIPNYLFAALGFNRGVADNAIGPALPTVAFHGLDWRGSTTFPRYGSKRTGQPDKSHP